MEEPRDAIRDDAPWRIVDTAGRTRGPVRQHATGLAFPADAGGLAIAGGAFGGAVALLDLALPTGYWLQGDCWLEGEEANDPVNLDFCLAGSCEHQGVEVGNHFRGGRLKVFLDKPSQVAGRVRNGDGRFLSISVSLSRAGLQRLAAEQALPQPLQRLAERQGPTPYEAEFHMDAALMRVAQELAQGMRLGSGPGLGLYREAKTLELLATLVMQWADTRTRPQSKLTARDHERLGEARERLVANLADPPTIEQLAQSAGMGQTRFREAFQQCFGKPVYEYLRITRLETARMLIQQGMSLQLAVFRVGYHDLSSFIRAFRRHFGCTPGRL
ncbi:MAG: AraC family transcriptional regulator [Candidatus Krumholzibacteria bacterium]|jgi:AraC-like DNA-binding protein|nr:AraC family transcriptional regulator [Candidatus Krumholzibacteria bacterium]